MAGWYNGDPASLYGQTQNSVRLGGIPATLIGRFSFEEFSLDGSSFDASESGPGTSVSFGTFLIQGSPDCPDTDGGVDDCVDGCPEDPNKTEPATAGAG